MYYQSKKVVKYDRTKICWSSVKGVCKRNRISVQLLSGKEKFVSNQGRKLRTINPLLNNERMQQAWQE